MKLTHFDKTMAAIAFAEHNDHETARSLLEKKKTKPAPAPARSGSGIRALVYGALSVGLYYLVFVNENLISDLYTKGRWHAALPIATVFLFSFIHGSFASHSLSALGIEARKKH